MILASHTRKTNAGEITPERYEVETESVLII